MTDQQPRSLDTSPIQRQNILNNPYAVAEIQKAVAIQAIAFEGDHWLLKEQVASFYGVDPRTIERICAENETELGHNGYVLCRGKRLKSLKLALSDQFGPDIDVGTKTTVLGIFSFRAFLNLGMLLSDSPVAKQLRQMILDIVIDTVNQRTGGGTKYINQRDEDFLLAYFRGEDYRKEFTEALRDCVGLGKFKYPNYTDRIYRTIFREDAKEYRKVLKLAQSDKTRDTFYSEVLDLIASFETGLAAALRAAFERKGTPLNTAETNSVFASFEQQPHWKPLIDSARQKMASRDLCFRDALHQQLEQYITPVQAGEFERFLGEKSKELLERMNEAQDVFKRLKERE